MKELILEIEKNISRAKLLKIYNRLTDLGASWSTRKGEPVHILAETICTNALIQNGGIMFITKEGLLYYEIMDGGQTEWSDYYDENRFWFYRNIGINTLFRKEFINDFNKIVSGDYE